ncbi:MAG: peptidylprolyl isomerase [Pseudomonadota bacterium]|jgi:parvulin-like peptidyl-prolyl isomerase
MPDTTVRDILSADRFSAVTFSICMAVLVVLCTAHTAHTADRDKPVARVNGVTIYQSDISVAVEANLARKLTSPDRGSTGSDPGAGTSIAKKTLKELIGIELLYQESLKHRFHGLIAESEERYRKEAQRLGGEDNLISALECNNMTPEQFRKAIFRNLSIKRLLSEEVYSKIQVTEQQVTEFYERNKERFREPRSVRISQILVKVPSDGSDESWRHARERAWSIYQNAVTGHDFVRLVRKHSDDPASASSGGDLGTIQYVGSLYSESQTAFIDTIIFRLSEGTVTEPIRSPQGFHIIKVNSIKPSTIKKLEDVKQRIMTIIRRQRAREMITTLIQDLQEKAEIEIMSK